MGGVGEKVRCMERVTWKLTFPCEMDSQQEFAVCLRELKQGLCDTGSPKPVLGDNLHRWKAEGRGRGVQAGVDMCTPMAASCCCMAETNAIL